MQPTGLIVEATSELFERTKTDKDEGFNWTPKRRAALDYLVQARGNVRVAAELSKKGPMPISSSYLRDLKYSAKYQPFREEYERRTGELLSALDIDTEHVLQRYVDLTRPDVPPSVRRQALRDLGQYLGMFTPKTKEPREPETTMERIRRAIEQESDPDRKRAIGEAFETLANILQ